MGLVGDIAASITARAPPSPTKSESSDDSATAGWTSVTKQTPPSEEPEPSAAEPPLPAAAAAPVPFDEPAPSKKTALKSSSSLGLVNMPGMPPLYRSSRLDRPMFVDAGNLDAHRRNVRNYTREINAKLNAGADKAAPAPPVVSGDTNPAPVTVQPLAADDWLNDPMMRKIKTEKELRQRRKEHPAEALKTIIVDTDAPVAAAVETDEQPFDDDDEGTVLGAIAAVMEPCLGPCLATLRQILGWDSRRPASPPPAAARLAMTPPKPTAGWIPAEDGRITNEQFKALGKPAAPTMEKPGDRARRLRAEGAAKATPTMIYGLKVRQA